MSRLARRTDIPGAIHDTRRSLKRLRALLRLLRPGLTKAAYRREAKRLAGTGRLLAGARDHYVMQSDAGKTARSLQGAAAKHRREAEQATCKRRASGHLPHDRG